LKYLWQLGRDTRFAEIVSVHDAEVLIVAALLHDIGHWPFCHPIEDMELPQMPPHEVFREGVFEAGWRTDSGAGIAMERSRLMKCLTCSWRNQIPQAVVASFNSVRPDRYR
jgi:HD superfamily phosphohydrolase